MRDRHQHDQYTMQHTLQADVDAGEGDLQRAGARHRERVLEREQRLGVLLFGDKRQRRQRRPPQLHDVVQRPQLLVDALVHLRIVGYGSDRDMPQMLHSCLR